MEQRHFTMNSQEQFVFTDGACSGNPGPGGWAFVGSNGKTVFEKGGSKALTTNNEMELLAALEALLWIEPHAGRFHFYADSIYVLKGLSQWRFGWSQRGWKNQQGDEVANRDLWQELHGLLQRGGLGSRIQYHYVRGHQGIYGNERCDEIAVEFSKNRWPDLFAGPLELYNQSLWIRPENTELPESQWKDPADKKKPMGYLSNVGGVIVFHKDWPSCQRATQGQSGALFKKVMTQNEVEDLLKKWGKTISQVKGL